MKIKKIPKTKTYIVITLISSILWILWFIISLYNYNSIKNISFTQEGKDNNQQNINVESNSNISSVNQYNGPVIPKSEDEIKKQKISDTALSTVKDFYNYLNNENYDRLFSLFDEPFKNDSNIRTYFSEDRITNFLNLIDGTWKPQQIEEELDDRKDINFLIRRGFRYNLKYEVELKDYIETWKMILVSRDGGSTFSVNSIYCEERNCSKKLFYR